MKGLAARTQVPSSESSSESGFTSRCSKEPSALPPLSAFGPASPDRACCAPSTWLASKSSCQSSTNSSSSVLRTSRPRRWVQLPGCVQHHIMTSLRRKPLSGVWMTELQASPWRIWVIHKHKASFSASSPDRALMASSKVLMRTDANRRCSRAMDVRRSSQMTYAPSREAPSLQNVSLSDTNH